MRGKWLLLAVSAILIAAAAGAIAVWRQDRIAKDVADRPTPAPPPVPSGEINLSGKIQARDVIYVDTEVSGRIQAFFADIGQDIYEGQLLARISNQSLESMRGEAQGAVENAQQRINKIESSIISARLEASRARADASRARAEFDRMDKVYRRQKMLYGEGATARLTYEKSEAEFNNAKTEFETLDVLATQAEERVGMLMKDLEAAKRTLDDKTRDLEGADAEVRSAEVRSPVTGAVVSRRGVVGDEVHAGAGSPELFGITPDISALDVVLEPEPPVLERLERDTPAVVILADVPEPVQGTVREIQGDQVFVAFTSPNPIIRPGMSAQVRLNLD
jgi:multidrug resistance efflux pump